MGKGCHLIKEEIKAIVLGRSGWGRNKTVVVGDSRRCGVRRPRRQGSMSRSYLTRRPRGELHRGVSLCSKRSTERWSRGGGRDGARSVIESRGPPIRPKSMIIGTTMKNVGPYREVCILKMIVLSRGRD